MSKEETAKYDFDRVHGGGVYQRATWRAESIYCMELGTSKTHLDGQLPGSAPN